MKNVCEKQTPGIDDFVWRDPRNARIPCPCGVLTRIPAYESSWRRFLATAEAPAARCPPGGVASSPEPAAPAHGVGNTFPSPCCIRQRCPRHWGRLPGLLEVDAWTGRTSGPRDGPSAVDGRRCCAFVLRSISRGSGADREVARGHTAVGAGAGLPAGVQLPRAAPPEPHAAPACLAWQSTSPRQARDPAEVGGPAMPCAKARGGASHARE